ncbi:MAG TPA: AMP-binding protein [Gammaproteobacteria bacterium]|nr:AMP-binding protein [Gammaproteobacteria bacterium]
MPRATTSAGTSTLPDYREVYARSLDDRDGFWAEAAALINWYRPWTDVLDASGAPFARWFPGAELNTCYNCVDRHVAAGRGDDTALIYDSPVTRTVARYSYAELKAEVARLAGALAALGVGRGDTVVIYMPMVPEAVFAMLACARLGAVHSVVFGGFAARELAARIDDCKPNVVLSASCGIEPGRIVAYKPLLDRALEMASHRPRHCVILERDAARAELDPPRDLDWSECVEGAAPHDCVAVAGTDPLYILYTSGTTGRPKGVVRDNGGHAVALAWSMRNVYGINSGETYWAASDIGWVVGHSYIVYGPLLNGNATVLYEGKPVGTPDAGAFWRVIAGHRVAMMFTAPTALRAIKREDPDAAMLDRYDLGGFRALFLAGERTDPATLRWARERLGVPVVDHWWQTETGWAITASCRGLAGDEVRDGSGGQPVPGFDVRTLGDDGRELGPDETGALAVKLPMPPGTFLGLWQAEAQCRATYYEAFAGYYRTADAGYIDADGFVFVMSRTDDVINVAGHRLSTGAMEEVLAALPDVAECAVCGVADELKGEVPIGFLVLKSGSERPHADIAADAIAAVRGEIGPVAAFKTAVVVKRLPKTRSGKVLRGVMRRIANGESWTMPATIDDPAILDEIAASLKGAGLPRSAASSAPG